LIKKQELPQAWLQLIADRLNDPVHHGDKGPIDVWHTYQNDLLAVISVKDNLPVGIVEVSKNFPPGPSWWIDKQFREKGYAKATIDELAELLVDSGVTEVGGILYQGQFQVASKKPGEHHILTPTIQSFY